MTNRAVITRGSPRLSWADSGLSPACQGSLRAVRLLLAASGCSWDDFARTKADHENDVPHDRLEPPILSHSEFSSTQGVFGDLKIFPSFLLEEGL